MDVFEFAYRVIELRPLSLHRHPDAAYAGSNAPLAERPAAGGAVKFTDGSRYVGEMKNGVPHGNGCFIGRWESFVYSGEWEYGKRSGFGILDAGSGDSYIGQWSGGMRHGKGKYVCSVGNWSYEGDWLDDRRVSHTDMQKEHGSLMAGKKKILIVDDQMGIRLLLQEVFKNGGYDAYQASSAKEAMAMVKKVAPDLIIHDLVMPDVDGWESIDRMLQYNAGLKIMAISAYWPDDKPNAIFTKPFDIDEFMSFVNGVLNGTVALGSPYRDAPVGKGSYG